MRNSPKPTHSNDTYTRNEIMHELLIGVNKKGKPAQGLMWEIAKKYDVHWKTVSRIWAKVKTQKKEGATLDASNMFSSLRSKTYSLPPKIIKIGWHYEYGYGFL